MWQNRLFYTSTRAIGHHLKSSGNSRSSNSIKPIIRRVSRRISINQTASDRRTQEGTREGVHNSDYNTQTFYKHNHNFIYKTSSQIYTIAEDFETVYTAI